MTKNYITMKNTGFWRNAAVCGAIIGAVDAVITVFIIGFNLQGHHIGLLEFLLFLFLVWYFTRRYAVSRGDRGCPYADCLGYIAAMMLFAGAVYGIIYAISVATFLGEQTAMAIEQSIEQVEQLGLYTSPQLKQSKSIMTFLMTNPFAIFITSTLSLIFRGVFFGLFISLLTKRPENIFADEQQNG